MRLMVATAVAILGADAAVMVLLRLLPDRSSWLAVSMDTCLLLIPLPVLYLLWYRPLARELDERARIHHELQHQGLHDALTLLPNRVWLRQHLAEAVDTARLAGASFALIVLDLSRFRVVNGSLGHATGDRLLEQVAARLKGALTGADAVARLGADVFGILRHGVGPDDASLAAELLYELMETP
ncbi:MAG TPA: GGDEF domain-containing protein, partial [Polyangiaceae bacterium]|nr:GGDEF domain-containing protein [Polyangiaceae bacterium]